jgi:hypothetical protein
LSVLSLGLPAVRGFAVGPAVLQADDPNSGSAFFEPRREIIILFTAVVSKFNPPQF